jgi:hypothetical protein
MAVHLSPPEQGMRRRRAHQKSRTGCGNCKLRRVKCDETQPRCNKCISFGVSCNYDATLDELQMVTSGTFVFGAPHETPMSFNQTVLSMVNTPPRAHSPNPRTSFYELRLEDLEIVSRFQSRTVLTIGTKESVHMYQREWFRVACEHSMLMQIILAMTLMHDRHIAGFADTPQSVAEAYHHYQGTAMIKRKLTDHDPHERDALCAAAALLGALSFANIDARTYEEAWPLKAPSESDLDWLSMTGGKMVVWKLVDPMREGSVIQEAWQQAGLLKPSELGLSSCPTFIELNSLMDGALGEDNVHQNAASALMPLLAIECNHSTIAKFMSFVCHTEPEYRQLLGQKDPLALLLLAYWYAKMCQYKQWWIQPRAVLECQAICVYLENYHRDENRIQSLLHFPRTMSGLASG